MSVYNVDLLDALLILPEEHLLVALIHLNYVPNHRFDCSFHQFDSISDQTSAEICLVLVVAEIEPEIIKIKNIMSS